MSEQELFKMAKDLEKQVKEVSKVMESMSNGSLGKLDPKLQSEIKKVASEFNADDLQRVKDLASNTNGETEKIIKDLINAN